MCEQLWAVKKRGSAPAKRVGRSPNRQNERSANSAMNSTFIAVPIRQTNGMIGTDLASEAWLESILRRNIKLLDANLILSPIYNQFRSSNDKIDLLAIRKDGRLVIIEIKTSPDRDMIFQAADYWRKIELQRRRGVLAEARLFGSQAIARPSGLDLRRRSGTQLSLRFRIFCTDACIPRSSSGVGSFTRTGGRRSRWSHEANTRDAIKA